jgi:Concanavalin A-like lectin/glucanases superfamily
MPGNDSSATLLIHANGVDGSATFTDVAIGGGAHTVTPRGDAQVDTAQSKFGGGSFLGDGTGDGLDVTGGTAGALSLGTGDFVLETWVRLAGTGFVDLFDFRLGSGGNTTLIFYVDENNNLIGYYDGSFHDGLTDIVTGVWYHLAMVRSSGVVRLFKNGVQVGSDVNDTANYDSDAVSLGINGTNNDQPLNGWMDEIRISKGTDRGWFNGFTPPVEEYDGVVQVVAASAGAASVSALGDGLISGVFASSGVAVASGTGFGPDQTGWSKDVALSGTWTPEAPYAP